MRGGDEYTTEDITKIFLTPHDSKKLKYHKAQT